MVRVHEGPPAQSPRAFQPSQPSRNPSGRGALTLSAAIDAFLLSRTVAGCTTLAVQRSLSTLRERVRPTTAHLHFSKLRALFRWCVEADLLAENPLSGLTMKVPKTLPRVPEDEAMCRVLAAGPDAFEGRRNRALVALLADSGLRISEALRLLIEDVSFGSRTISVRAGKGQKDGVGFLWSRNRTVHPGLALEAPRRSSRGLSLRRPARA